ENGRYMEIAINWPDKDEAVQILQALYGRFTSKTIETETATTTAARQALEDQLKDIAKQADDKAAARVRYLTKNYWQQPTLLGSTMGSREALETQIAESKLEVTDANLRLAKIAKMLSVTQPEEPDSVEEVKTFEKPWIELARKK